MNERIKELYEQSLTRETGKDHTGNPMLTIRHNPEKFAELIIRECAEWVDQNLGLVDEEAKADLLKHFGVEE